MFSDNLFIYINEFWKIILNFIELTIELIVILNII